VRKSARAEALNIDREQKFGITSPPRQPVIMASSQGMTSRGRRARSGWRFITSRSTAFSEFCFRRAVWRACLREGLAVSTCSAFDEGLHRD